MVISFFLNVNFSIWFVFCCFIFFLFLFHFFQHLHLLFVVFANKEISFNAKSVENYRSTHKQYCTTVIIIINTALRQPECRADTFRVDRTRVGFRSWLSIASDMSITTYRWRICAQSQLPDWLQHTIIIIRHDNNNNNNDAVSLSHDSISAQHKNISNNAVHRMLQRPQLLSHSVQNSLYILLNDAPVNLRITTTTTTTPV